MILGAFIVLYSLLRLTRKTAPSQILLPWIKLELKGPAWLVAALIGVLMVATPVIGAILQRSDNVTRPLPPASVERVRSILDPSYESFRFLYDVSLLDLRASTSSPWYTSLPGWTLIDPKPRIRPAILKNYMVVRKVAPTNEIHITYSTSGRLDVRCLTHQARFRKAVSTEENDNTTETWEVIADVSSVPVGESFEIVVEATYWNAFSGPEGDDFSTYSHNQTDPEVLSAVLIFPEDKPFKDVAVTEYSSEADTGTPFQGSAKTLAGPENRTFYWSTTSTRAEFYYKLAWRW